jgi:hypothetical protein
MSTKKEDSFGGGFIVGVLAGLFIAVLAIYNTDSDRADLEACQKNLPRSSYCVMLAVPSNVAIKFKSRLGVNGEIISTN